MLRETEHETRRLQGLTHAISALRLLRMRSRVGLGSYALIVPWCAFTLLAFLWVILSSFKSTGEIFRFVWHLPQSFYWQNYIKAWSVVNMGQYFLNSVIVVSASVVFIMAISSPSAYVLGRISFRGSRFLTGFFASGMGIPVQLLFIPLFALLTRIRLTDSLAGLGVVYIAISLPFTVFFLTGFFRSLPSELEEAAAIDGASPGRTFLQVMLPISSPGLIAAAIFNFVWLWNEYSLALIFISRDARRPLSLGLYALQGSMQFTGDWGGLFAGAVIVMVPTALFYIWMSERIISGITVGAVKG